MALTPEEQRAKNAGWALPEGDDLISGGDDAIRKNATTARAAITAGDSSTLTAAQQYTDDEVAELPTYAYVDEQTEHVPQIVSSEEWRLAETDDEGRISRAVDSEGRTWLRPHPSSPGMLDPQIADQVERVNAPGWAWTITDEGGRIALGVRDDGTVTGGAAGSISGYDVILLVGQSNMQGRGAQDLDRGTWPGIDQFPAASRPDAGTIIPAQDPLDHPGTKILDTPASLAIPFARRYRQENPGRGVLLVPAAAGATAFSSTDQMHWDWTVSTGTPLAPLAVQQTKDALDAAGSEAKLVGILWHQGEGDLGIADEYADKLDGLINYFRTELDAPNVPVVVGQMSMDRGQIASRLTVDAAHQQTPARVERTAFVPSPRGLHNPGDAVHFSTRALDVMGRDYYTGLMRAAYNVAGALPLGPENVRATRTGDEITVTWDPAWSRATDYRIEWHAGDGSWTEAGVDHQLSVGLTATIVTPAAVQVRVTTINETGASPGVVANVVGTTGVQQTSISPTDDWRTDLDTEITAYRDGNVVSVAAWRLAANADVTGSVVAYRLPVGYQPAGYQTHRVEDTRSASVALSYDGTVTISDPSGAVAHHAFTFITLDPMPD